MMTLTLYGIALGVGALAFGATAPEVTEQRMLQLAALNERLTEAQGEQDRLETDLAEWRAAAAVSAAIGPRPDWGRVVEAINAAASDEVVVDGIEILPPESGGLRAVSVTAHAMKRNAADSSATPATGRVAGTFATRLEASPGFEAVAWVVVDGDSSPGSFTVDFDIVHGSEIDP